MISATTKPRVTGHTSEQHYVWKWAVTLKLISAKRSGESSPLVKRLVRIY